MATPAQAGSDQATKRGSASTFLLILETNHQTLSQQLEKQKQSSVMLTSFLREIQRMYLFFAAQKVELNHF